MLRDLVQPFLRATFSLELAEFQQAVSINSLHDLGISQVRPRLYLRNTDLGFVFLNSLHL